MNVLSAFGSCVQLQRCMEKTAYGKANLLVGLCRDARRMLMVAQLLKECARSAERQKITGHQLFMPGANSVKRRSQTETRHRLSATAPQSCSVLAHMANSCIKTAPCISTIGHLICRWWNKCNLREKHLFYRHACLQYGMCYPLNVGVFMSWYDLVS